MDPAEEFDQWAADGEDRGMESRHWHTAKSALERLPIEAGDTVVDLGTGSGYALRALRDATPVGPCYGLDASPQMLANARSYAEDNGITFLRGSFDALGARGFGRVDFRMEADGSLFVLELNTVPGFTETSLLPKAAAAAGTSFSALCDHILNLATFGA